jgi:nicotinamidase-related amidase
MASIRAGQRSALLVVDVQVGVVARAWDYERIVGNVARAVDRARAASVPVIWVQHAGDELPVGSPAWQWALGLAPAAQEVRIDKRHNSSFEQTPLEHELARAGITHLVLAGASTNWCIRATAYAALERGYDLTLLADAHTTETLELDDGRSIEASVVIEDLNLTMRWLDYPGRRNRVATAEAVDFGVVDP